MDSSIKMLDEVELSDLKDLKSAITRHNTYDIRHSVLPQVAICKWNLEITLSLNCNQASKGLSNSAGSYHVKCIVYSLYEDPGIMQAKQIKTVLIVWSQVKTSLASAKGLSRAMGSVPTAALSSNARQTSDLGQKGKDWLLPISKCTFLILELKIDLIYLFKPTHTHTHTHIYIYSIHMYLFIY